MNTLIELQETILDSELRHVNFFNGRLLSSEDLSAERDANHAHARRLGQAIGQGVAFGLEVSRADTSPSDEVQLKVTAGLAVNRAGQTLHLKCDQVVALVRSTDPAKTDQCVFADCGLSTLDTGLSGDGFYLLTIAPASQTEGLAPVSGLGNTPAACNSRYITEGVQFRLLPFSSFQFQVSGHARNEVAYHCFGRPTTDVETFLDQAFGLADAADYGTPTHLPSGQLAESDVPLAVVEWRSASGLRFVDEWAVRRPLTTRAAAGGWNYFAAGRRVSEAIAMLLQFQKHLAELPAVNGSFATVKASEHFTWLPATGMLPVGGKQFDYEKFFEGIPLDETNTELAFLNFLLRKSLIVEPFNLVSAPPDSIQIFKFSETSDFVLFARGEALAPPPVTDPTPPSDPPTGDTSGKPPQKGFGQFVIGVKVPKKSEANAKDAQVRIRRAGKRGFEVIEAKGVELVRSVSIFDKFSKFGTDIDAVFVTEKIEFGTYTIGVELVGCEPWIDDVTLDKTRVQVTVALEAKRRPAGPKQRGEIKFNGSDYKVVLFPVPMPPEDTDPWIRERNPGYVDPPREAVEKIREQIWTMIENDKNFPAKTETIRLLVDKAYTGDSVPDGPAAILEGAGGTGLPLVLIRADQSLPLEVSTALSDVREFTSGGLQAKLAAAGVDDLQVASNLPARLFAEITGVDVAAARGMIGELKIANQRVRENRTYYPGLSNEDAKLLKEKFDDVGLANASTAEIVSALTGPDANNLPPDQQEGLARYAERLKGYARSLVPAAAWSLENSGLGFSDSQIAALRDKGIGSVEAVTKKPAFDLISALGWNAEVVAKVQQSAGVNLAAGRIALNPEPPLTSVARINNDFAVKLSGAGINSTLALASADTDKVAATLNISKDEAVTIVKSATTEVLTKRGGLSAIDANQAVTDAGAAKLQDVVERTVAAVDATPGASDSPTVSNLRALRNVMMRK